MSLQPISPHDFHAADGVDDWRALYSGACAYFRSDSYRTSAAFVAAIAALDEADEARPDVDLRHDGVAVRLVSRDIHRMTGRDLRLARGISALARESSLTADPSAVQDFQLALGAVMTAKIMPFWRAVLGYEQVGDEDLLDPRARGPLIWFKEMASSRPNMRIHVDVSVPHDQAEGRIAAAIEAGGRVVDDSHAPAWVTLADPEDNKVDIATWMGRE
jgi:4a-hydroxytetrahydrobiopterin dehydratase